MAPQLPLPRRQRPELSDVAEPQGVVPEGHLAWFVIDAVDDADIGSFCSRHGNAGRGAPAFDPEMMVTLLLYAYCHRRAIVATHRARCHEDIAFRVVTANSAPHHTTIARFRQANEDALAPCFTDVLRPCAAADLVRLGFVAPDGTKIEANASLHACTRSVRFVGEAGGATRKDPAPRGGGLA